LKYDYVTIRSSSDEPIALAGAAPSNHPGAPAQPLVPSPGDTTYYVDSSGGSDDHKGTSAQSAWKSLAKLNGIEFKPGDKILLKAGCRFMGPLRSNGSGAEGKPILIDRYGDGADPLVAGEGKVENTIRLHNQHHWEIRNLTVTNTDGGDWTDAGRAIRRAIYVTAEDAGDIRHIHLQNLEIRKVRGMFRFAGHETNGGIICQVLGKSKKTRFVDLRIEDCTFRTRSIDRYWGSRGSVDGNMKMLVTYSIYDWPIPDHKALIDFTLGYSKGQFKGRGCHAFNQIFSVAEARRQFPDGYRGDEIDKSLAQTFLTFLGNWNERINFYSKDWNGKHNNGVPLFVSDLMLDLPIMRGSTVYNWRENPVITRHKDGTIRRNKVIYQTKGFPFGG
jgi:hypothetical protein